MAKSYSEKLQDPRWQKKRLKCLERFEWKCGDCGAVNKTLHVHHKTYDRPGADPWDTPDGNLVACCHDCHEARESLAHRSRLIFQVMPLGHATEIINEIFSRFSADEETFAVRLLTLIRGMKDGGNG